MMEDKFTLQQKEYLWISALETSADLHGQKLMAALKQMGCPYPFIGIGGINMQKQGMYEIFSSDEFSVMGLFEVLSYLPKIISSYNTIKKIFFQYKIKGVILIDAPDFHFRIAKMAWKLNIPVFYYISPQVWAWRKGRVKFLKKYITKLCCIFPFEKQFFQQHDLEVEYVGHPLMEYLNFPMLDSMEKEEKSLILMPGSRLKEVQSILPIIARACEIISNHNKDTIIKIVKAPNIHKDIIAENWTSNLKYHLVPFENRYLEMAKSEMAIVASGTASLECGLLRLPAVVVYKVSFLTYLIGRLFVNTEYISMTNIILNKKVFPEFIQGNFTAENVARTILKWTSTPHLLKDIRDDLSLLRKKLGSKKASIQTAKIILNYLTKVNKAGSGT